ncbi:MAG: protein kinase [candidate division Zixibacteria bacterium]|nr:protein kinase [candidate division Zixibacteria bacterium]
MIGQTVSHYKIIEKLGEGGMGEVYLAEDMSLGRKVAVKFLASDKATDPESRKRFVHEARAQALVSHTNVASFYEVGEEGDKVFIVMEYIEGQKLSELAKAEKPSLPEILDLAIQIGEGLTAAHEKGVMHRDINPANILVTSKRVAKITDFGLAKWKGASTITRTGLQMGTDHYMSPEEVEGRKADFRTDIFSLGVVLYELICARQPFEGANRESLFYEILYTQPQPLARFCRGVPESLERLVMKCLAKKPEERYQSAADLVADLRMERKNIEYAKPSDLKVAAEMTKPKKKMLKFLVPTSAVVVLAVLFFVFNPFKVEVSRKQTALAAENSLAVMYFENIPDPEDKDHTGEMLTNLLITSLSQLKGWEVISRQRLYDIQADMGKPDEKRITPALASKIAQRVGVRTMLLGTVLQSQPKLAATSQLIEVKSGKILNSQRLTGFSADQIFAFVDSFAVLVRGNLNIDPGAASETKPVMEVTTASLEAYRAYVEGVELIERFDYKQAPSALEKALELDPKFAMAYLMLAYADLGNEDIAGHNKALQKAYELSDRVPERERLRIQGKYALEIENDFVKAAEIFEKLLKEHPYDFWVYFYLKTVYLWLGDYEKSTQTLLAGLTSDSLDKRLWNELSGHYAGLNRRKEALDAVDQYIKLAPAEFNPYDTKGDVYLYFGELDSALLWYQKAFMLRSNIGTNEKLAHDALSRGDYASSEKYIRQYDHTDIFQKPIAEYDLSLMFLHQGKFKEAKERLLANLSSHLARNNQAQILKILATLVHLSYILGNYSEMLDYAKKLSDHPTHTWWVSTSGREILAWAYIMNGQEKIGYRIMDEVKKDLNGHTTVYKRRHDFYTACLTYEEGKYGAALDAFKKIRHIEPPNSIPNLIYALCLLKAGQSGDAIVELERLIRWYPPVHYSISFLGFSYAPNLWPMAPVLAHYWLGVAYEQKEEKDKAKREYETFLDIWKNADPGIAEVEDAKERLARLKKKV